MQLWHDGTGFGADWYPAKLVIEAVAYGSKYEAVFDAWLKGGEDKGATRPLRLVAGAHPSQTPAGQAAYAAFAAGALRPPGTGVLYTGHNHTHTHHAHTAHCTYAQVWWVHASWLGR